jgi:toxin-antitoxin system, antitoxin component, xre family
MEIFSRNLKKYRLLRGYHTAKEFAEKISIPYPTYISYESNNREPKYDILCKISNSLKISIDELLGNEFIKNQSDINLSIEIIDCIKRALGESETNKIMSLVNKI